MKLTTVIVAFALLLLGACADSTVVEKQQPLAGSFPAGKLYDDNITYEFAIYYLPNPKKPPLAELDDLLSKQSLFKRVETLDKKDGFPRLTARLESDPQSNYAPPEPDFLKNFGYGLTPAQTQALQNTRAAFVLDFAYSQEHVWSGLRAALDLTTELAKSTGGLLWDETTREVFTREAWTERRITDWTEDVPNISHYTVIHSYSTGDYLRSISLGMEKFGLPDIVIDRSPRSLNRNAGHLINMFAQVTAEGATIQKAGEFDLDFRSIRNPKVREPQVNSLEDKATGIARLSLRVGRWEEGDPKNRLIELAFDRGGGPDFGARQEQIMAEAFGSTDSIVDVEHDEEILEASRRARAKLGSLRTAFNKGFPPGEFLLVKAPFDTPDGGNEWMWVEVVSWKGKAISGPLQNEPFNIPTLRSGQRVTVSEEDIFDYILNRADGSSEGNETGKIIQSRTDER